MQNISAFSKTEEKNGIDFYSKSYENIILLGGFNAEISGSWFLISDNLITFPVSGFCFSEKAEIFCVELNLRKQKWLILWCYDHHNDLIKDYLLKIKNAINFLF